MKRVFIIAGMALSLAACQTREGQLNKFDTEWIGFPMSHFLANTGMPLVSSYDTSNGRNFIFESHRSVVEFGLSRRNFNSQFDTQPVYATTVSCRVRILAQLKGQATNMDHWVVSSMSHTGNC